MIVSNSVVSSLYAAIAATIIFEGVSGQKTSRRGESGGVRRRSNEGYRLLEPVSSEKSPKASKKCKATSLKGSKSSKSSSSDVNTSPLLEFEIYPSPGKNTESGSELFFDDIKSTEEEYTNNVTSSYVTIDDEGNLKARIVDLVRVDDSLTGYEDLKVTMYCNLDVDYVFDENFTLTDIIYNGTEIATSEEDFTVVGDNDCDYTLDDEETFVVDIYEENFIDNVTSFLEECDGSEGGNGFPEGVVFVFQRQGCTVESGCDTDDPSNMEAVAYGAIEPADGGACFPGDALVDVHQGGNVFLSTLMKDLKTGDEVKCVKYSTNQVGVCTVFFHGHQSYALPQIGQQYTKVVYGAGGDEYITLSAFHILYRFDKSDVSLGDTLDTLPPYSNENIDQFLEARNVGAGDWIAVADPNDATKFIVTEVLRIEDEAAVDAYAPIVSDGGTFFVNNALASSYIVLQGDGAIGSNIEQDTAQHFLNAVVGTYYYQAIELGIRIDKTPFWNLARDDPTYLAWEREFYDDVKPRKFLRGELKDVFRDAFIGGLTLTGGQAILFEKEIQELYDAGTTLAEANVEPLLRQAFQGLLS